jgi:putative protein-disulfide isomerase
MQPEVKINCDPETGLCAVPEISNVPLVPTDWKTDEEIIYVGDPMCSWCWGLSPQLNALQRYGQQLGIPFSLVMGGLRPGGGEAWNADFKGFLKHHWEEVTQRSGQPFGYGLFDLEDFNYDTEPACRAVVTARSMAPEKTLSFYELVQHAFYMQSKDPKQVEFYQPICAQLNLDYTAFAQQFATDEMKYATQQDFAQNRQWGVTGFPAVIYRNKNELSYIAKGYSDFDRMKGVLDALTSNAKNP